MKFVIALAALIAVAMAADPARPTPARNDFRNEFDFLLAQKVDQELRRLEQVLEDLSRKVADLEKTKKAEEKEDILREITVVEGAVNGGKEFYQRELKRTDLDLVERYDFESIIATQELLTKDLAELTKRVKAIDVSPKKNDNGN